MYKLKAIQKAADLAREAAEREARAILEGTLDEVLEAFEAGTPLSPATRAKRAEARAKLRGQAAAPKKGAA